MSIDLCAPGTACNPISELCELPPDPRIFLAAAIDPTAAFSGEMMTGSEYASGLDDDPAADSLLPTLAYPSSGFNSFQGGSGDEVSYLVDIPATGAWYLWARMYYPGSPGSNHANSFLVSVDGGQMLKLGNNKDYFQQWHWDGDGAMESGPPVPLALGVLGAGIHEIVIERREASPVAPRLDVILLTPDPAPVAPLDLEARSALGLP